MTTTENTTPDLSSEYGKMSDSAVARLRNRIGRVYPIEDPYIRYVNQDSITHIARCLGDMNPLFVDPDYAAKTRWGKLIAPPALFYAVAWGSWDLRRGQGLPGVHGLHSGDEWQYFKPVYDGDKLHATKSLVKADEKPGRFASKMLLQVDEIKFYNQNDELVAIQIMPAFRMERGDGKSTGKNSERVAATYTPEEIAQIDAEIKAEKPRGATPRNWEDVSIGDPMDQVTKGPLTVPDMISWLQGVGSPHVRTGKYWQAYREQSPKVAVTDPATGIPQAIERVHWDHHMASEIGLPSAYDYGSQRGGYATYYATQWAGDDGWVSEVNIQYRGIVYLGDVFRINGNVIDKWRGAKTGNGYIKADLNSINNVGENIMKGHVTIALPSKETGAVSFPVNVEEDGRA
ncbi:FAS1-like dehydratase domain-containing protein [Rhodococcus opacus]|uniref:FAS1-like dehydratase domain-containing protein n=1 Tax=Rhodococcus opacus TaxID=37919 RepID=UPI0024754A3E|nr:MaoC family dehydratase N-terminal domain-containing protein [Rhodococcus opacus]MDH6293297.1 acyl dehydratase [Rhodococcus opacus]